MSEQAPCRRCGHMHYPGEWCQPCIDSGRADRTIIATALNDGLYQGIERNDPELLAERVHEKLIFFERLPGPLRVAEDLPELVAEVERLRAALDRVRELATSYTPSPDLVEAIIEELDR